MISSVSGIIEDKGTDYVEINLGVIGVKILTSQRDISLMPKIGESTKLYTFLKVKEDDMQLYGFITKESVEMFILLISVSGVGPRSALSILSAFELDPRVLLIDDYGICFNDALEKEICKKIKSMNKEYGTTIVLSAPSDTYLKKLASVLIYLDNGHISKIRSGLSARSSKNIQQKNQNSTKRRRKFIKNKPKR